MSAKTAPTPIYRVKAEHPRRPGTPLRVTDRDGRLIAQAGDLCTHVPADQLASMIRNGYVEVVPDGEGEGADGRR